MCISPSSPVLKERCISQIIPNNWGRCLFIREPQSLEVMLCVSISQRICSCSAVCSPSISSLLCVLSVLSLLCYVTISQRTLAFLEVCWICFPLPCLLSSVSQVPQTWALYLWDASPLGRWSHASLASHQSTAWDIHIKFFLSFEMKASRVDEAVTNSDLYNLVYTI